jgi:hypothetical protein
VRGSGYRVHTHAEGNVRNNDVEPAPVGEHPYATLAATTAMVATEPSWRLGSDDRDGIAARAAIGAFGF